RATAPPISTLFPYTTLFRSQSVASAAAGCTRVAKPAPKPDGGRKPPKTRLDRHRKYDVTFVTNCGSFTIRLDVRHSPHTAASFRSEEHTSELQSRVDLVCRL